MKKNILSNAFFVAATIAYNFLFWGEKMGINTLFFTILMIVGLFIINPESKNSKTAIASTVGTLLTAIFVVINNTMLSKSMHILSFLMMIGFVQQRQLRFIGYGILLAFINFIEVPMKFMKELKIVKQFFPEGELVLKQIKFLVMPIFIVPVFFGLYYLANPNFANLSNSFFGFIGAQLTFDINPIRFIFFLTGCFISGAALWKSNFIYLTTKDKNLSEDLYRKKRINKFPTIIKRNLLALKDEYKTGLVLIFCLNGLLVIVNCIDLKYVWLNYETASPQSLSTYVHEGTYFLILAIIAAMAVVCYFFRRNINFLPENKLLKTAMYFWIAQNAVMVTSVAIRNYRYIDYYGLAYNRIGVMIFLTLTIFGLFTMVIKIKECKSTFFLLNRNSWAVYFALVMACSVNWDIFITQYNIKATTKNGVDSYLLMHKLTTKNLYLLDELKPTLQTKTFLSDEKFNNGISIKRQQFEKEQASLSWLSWNMADARNHVYLDAQD